MKREVTTRPKPMTWVVAVVPMAKNSVGEPTGTPLPKALRTDWAQLVKAAQASDQLAGILFPARLKEKPVFPQCGARPTTRSGTSKITG
jgi:hypothetical protein